MPRKWTRDERRKAIREKYFSWREKIFVLVLFFLVMFTTLTLALTGVVTTLPLQAITTFLVIIIVIVFFMINYGGTAFKTPSMILIGLFLFLVLIAAALLVGRLNEVEQFVVSVIIGIVFLLTIAISAFFIDLFLYESH